MLKKFLGNVVRRIVKTYKKYTESDLLTFSNNVYSLTSASPELANPTPTMATLQAAITKYSDLLTLSLNRDRLQVSLKNQARAELIELLDELANFTTLTANGDYTILVASGFLVNKIPGSVIIDTPLLSIMDGANPGELKSVIKGAANAKVFIHVLSGGPLGKEGFQLTETSTRRTHTFKGLTKGATYDCQATAIGSNEQAKVSLPVSRVVQ